MAGTLTLTVEADVVAATTYAFSFEVQNPAAAQGVITIQVQILLEKSFNLNISGNEVHCTIALLLPMKIMLCSKIYYQKVVD